LLSVAKHAEAIEDYNQAIQLNPENDGILNNLAWVLSTSPEDKLRDGKLAIELAKKACEVTKYEAPHILSTLAAAYAEAGDFKSAIEWSTKAVEMGRQKLPEQVEQLQQELDSYKAGKPFREKQNVEEKAAPPRRVIET
jgi:tetratricopeptide (TPR) repeat protein